MISSGYEMHLYCDYPDDSYRHKQPAIFTGETAGECRQKARRLGWKFRDGMTRVICPSCAKKGRTLARPA